MYEVEAHLGDRLEKSDRHSQIETPCKYENQGRGRQRGDNAPRQRLDDRTYRRFFKHDLLAAETKKAREASASRAFGIVRRYVKVFSI